MECLVRALSLALLLVKSDEPGVQRFNKVFCALAAERETAPHPVAVTDFDLDCWRQLDAGLIGVQIRLSGFHKNFAGCQV